MLRTLLLTSRYSENLTLFNGLQQDFFDLKVVFDSSQVEEYLFQNQIDLFFIDLNFSDSQKPDSLVNFLQGQDLNRLPIILIGNQENENLALQLLEIGCRDFLQKPFSIPFLKFKIETHLKNQTVFDTYNKSIVIQKELEEDLCDVKKNYAFLKTLVDYSNHWEIFRDVNHKPIYCSPNTEKITGYSVEEFMLGIPTDKIFHPEDLENAYEVIKRLLQGERVDSFTFRMIRKDGKFVWMEGSAQPVLSEMGEFIGFRTSLNDISKLKETESLIEESQNLLTLVTDNSSEWVVFLGTDGVVKYCSPSVEKLIGYNQEEFKAGCSLKKILHPEDYQASEIIFTEFIQEMKDIESFSARIIHKKTRQIVWLEGSAKIIYSKNNEFAGYRFSMRDVTELRNTQQELEESNVRYKLISDYTPDWEVYRGPNWELLYCNPAIENVLGYTVEEFKKELLFQNYIHPDDIQRVQDDVQQLIREKISRRDTYRFIKKNGDVIYMEVSSMPVITKDGVCHGYRLSSRDETEINHLHQELTKLNETKNKFFSIISHDLRSPFNALIGFSDILEGEAENISDEERKKYISIISQTSKNTLRLLDNLLLWAKSQSEVIVFNSEKIDLHDCLKDIISFKQSALLNKNITLLNYIPEHIYVNADPNMLSTVIRNLISNAIKFTDKNGEIVLDTTLKDDLIEISVSDTGIGMDEETKNSLFVLGMTKTSMGTENESGTGLGLLLCKEFVEKQGGEIYVESEVGKGSIFKFTLPLFIEEPKVLS